MVDRPRDGGGYTGQANLADPPRTKFVDFFVGVVQEMNVDRRHVGVYRHYVVGQITVDRGAALRIVRRVLEQRHTYSHHYRTMDLVPTGEWVDNAASIDDRHDTADAQSRDFRLPRNLHEVT